MPDQLSEIGLFELDTRLVHQLAVGLHLVLDPGPEFLGRHVAGGGGDRGQPLHRKRSMNRALAQRAQM